jgi:methyl-accepting chemotaxis protein
MDSVAFQTRLLALNASVEAARSGVEGKGFAVVAQEVRALAQRNAEAARTIDDIVTASLAEIEACNGLTERAVEAVAQTDLRIDAVHRAMGTIVSMTRDGMSAAQDVASEARRTASAIEGNAKLVDQLSVASADLRQQGESLRGSVAQFALH